jgi:hypothetical protein
MKTLGIILIVAGIIMIILKGFSVSSEKKILDAGPLQINKKENHWFGWPTYAGAIVSILGVVLVLSDKKKS